MRALAYGLLEGITEWLPISSTGHLILLSRFLSLPMSGEAFALFEVAVQFSAMAAIVVLFRKKLFPFAKTRKERKEICTLWGRICISAVPAAVIGLLFGGWLEEKLFSPLTVGVTLVFYGVLFLFDGKRKEGKKQVFDVTKRTALGVGLFQALALVPGTSRSGATVEGGVCLGLSRGAAAEYSFFLGVPTMLGAGVYESAKFFLSGGVLTGEEISLFAVGMLTSFFVSLLVADALVGFLRKHTLFSFGVYRVLLGTAVLIFEFLR